MNNTVPFQINTSFLRIILSASLFLIFSQISYGQKKILEKKISLNVREEKLEDILDQISSKSKVFFSYNSDLISEDQRFTLSIKNEKLYVFLDKLLIGTSLSYKIFRKQVIIYKKVKDKLNPKEKISLFGTIRDAITKEPINSVNVFISGSLKGNSSDKFGNFSISQLYPEVYEIVFSHVAYDIKLLKINAKHEKPIAISVLLIPKTVELKEVEVTADNQKGWNRHFYLFESEFLGNTINAAKCNIKNPEVIDFEYNNQTNTLFADSSQPLIIENDALGYEIEYYLQSFENNNNKSIIRGVLSFRENIPESRKELRHWNRNRKKSFKGSYVHFLKSLFNKKLKKEGFKVYLLDEIEQKPKNQISEDDVLFDYKKGLEVKIKFPKYLRIDYFKSQYMTSNEIIKAYYRTGNAIQNGVQTSYLKLNLPYATILEKGQLKEHFAVTKYGYWSWERVAEYLPFEYKP